jgi:hypothetical protein
LKLHMTVLTREKKETKRKVLDACLVFSRNVPDPATVHEGILIEIEHQLLKHLDSTR